MIESASQEVEGSDGLQPAIHGVGEREQPQGLKRKASADHGTGPDLERGGIAAAGAGSGATPRESASDTAEATSVARNRSGADRKRRLVTDVDTDMLPTPSSTEINTIKDEYQHTRRRGDEMPHGDLGVARARASHRTAPRPFPTDASTRRAVSPTTPIKHLLQRGPDTRLTPPSSGLLQISSSEPGDSPLTSSTRAAAPTATTPIRRGAFSADTLPRHLPTPPPTLPRLVRAPAPGVLAGQAHSPGGFSVKAVAMVSVLADDEVEVKVEPGTPLISIDDLPGLPDLPIQPDVREGNGQRLPGEARHDPPPSCAPALGRPLQPVNSELQRWHDLVNRTINAAKMRHPALPADASITAHIDALAGIMAEKDHIIQTLKDQGAVRASNIDWLVMERSTGTLIRPRPPPISIAEWSNTYPPQAMPPGIPQAQPPMPPAPIPQSRPPPSTVAEWAQQHAPSAMSPAVSPAMQQRLPQPMPAGTLPLLPPGGYPLMPPAMPFAVPPGSSPAIPPYLYQRPRPFPIATADWGHQNAPERMQPATTPTIAPAMPLYESQGLPPAMPPPMPPWMPSSMLPALPSVLPPPPKLSGPAFAQHDTAVIQPVYPRGHSGQPMSHIDGATGQHHCRLDLTHQSALHNLPGSLPRAEPLYAPPRQLDTPNAFAPYLQTPPTAGVPASAPPTMMNFPLRQHHAHLSLGHRPAMHPPELTPSLSIPPHPPTQLFAPMSDPVPSGPTHLSGGMSAVLPRWHPWTTYGLALPPSGDHHLPPHHLATAEPDCMPPAGLRSAPLVRTAGPTPLAGPIPAPVAVTPNTLQPRAHTPIYTTLQASRKSSPLTAAAPTAPTLLTATDNNCSPPHQLGAAIHSSAAGSNALRDRARE